MNVSVFEGQCRGKSINHNGLWKNTSEHGRELAFWNTGDQAIDSSFLKEPEEDFRKPCDHFNGKTCSINQESESTGQPWKMWNERLGTFLTVQGLRPCASNARVPVRSLAGGRRDPSCCTVQPKNNKTYLKRERRYRQERNRRRPGKVKAETGVMQTQVKECRKPGDGHGTDSLSELPEGTNPASTWTADFWPPELWENTFLL